MQHTWTNYAVQIYAAPESDSSCGYASLVVDVPSLDLHVTAYAPFQNQDFCFAPSVNQQLRKKHCHLTARGGNEAVKQAVVDALNKIYKGILSLFLEWLYLCIPQYLAEPLKILWQKDGTQSNRVL